MRKNGRFTFFLVIGLLFTLGTASASFAAVDDKDKKKRPKNTGTLSVTTTPTALPVKVDGKLVGMSGVGDPAEFYLTPGVHRVEIEGPNGQTFSREINIVKKVRNCICLNVVEKTTSRPCPYDMRVDGPATVTEGDLVTFVARNVAVDVPVDSPELNYNWKASPSQARIVSGNGTSSIVVDTTGLGGRTLMVELEVTDGEYDASCRQRIAVDTEIEKFPEVKTKPPILFDEFPFRSFDDDKARLDNLAIELQNNPTWNGYIIMYQGTDRRSQNAGEVTKLSEKALDYLVKSRGVDPARIQIVQGGTRLTTTYQFWLIPPGADLPVPN